MTNDIHIPVLLHEVLEYLRCKPGGRYLDCTAGMGGHTVAIARCMLPGGRIAGIDRDPDAVKTAKKRLEDFCDNAVILHGNFSDMKSLVEPLGITPLDGILIDLGFSSAQVQDAERGFSFMRSGPLDMRMDKSKGITAEEIVNTWEEEELARIIRHYGEERHWKRVARAIVSARQNTPVKTTLELVGIVTGAIPKFVGIHPATRVFQALRITVNRELEELTEAIPSAVELLATGGRLAVISYHSLEDRIVKEGFASMAKGCICPPRIPECRCGRKPVVKIVTKKVIRPTESEVRKNPRSRSAKMRVCEKLGNIAGR